MSHTSDSGPYRTPEPPTKRPDWFERNGYRIIGLVFVFGLGMNCVRWLHDDLVCPSPPECPPPPPPAVCPGPTRIAQECDLVCGRFGMQQAAHDYGTSGGVHYFCTCIDERRSCRWADTGDFHCWAILQ